MESMTFNMKQAAKYIGVNEHSFRQLVRAGEVPCFQVGRRMIIPKMSLEKWLSERAEAALR